MKVIIVSGGQPPKEETIKKHIEKDTYVISADKGTDTLYKYNISPNLILGDFDSIDIEILNYYEKKGCVVDRFKREKDFTDTEAAIEEAIKLKPTEILLFAATGTRIDHTLANIGLLSRCMKNNIKAAIIDENNEISIHNKSFKFSEDKGAIFSLQAFGEVVKGLNILGAKYPLNNYDLHFGDPRTVSNESIGEDIHITFNSGIVILIKAKD